MKRSNRKYFLEQHPWLPGGLTIAYVIFGVTIPVIVIYFPSIGDTFPSFFRLVSFILISAPITLTILQIINFRHSVINIRYLALLYLEIILMFGVTYFYAVSSRNKPDIEHERNIITQPLPIKGIDNSWVSLIKNGNVEDKKFTLKKMFICFQDCIHFSLITSTTVGYGDMVPVTPIAKLLVDIQVIVSFFLISFGVATFTSSQQRTHKDKQIQ